MGGWMIGYSLPLELDIALHHATTNESSELSRLPPAVLELVHRVPDDWREEWAGFMNQLPRASANLNMVSFMGSWAESMFESDFRQATLPMRELRLKDAIAKRTAQLKAYGETGTQEETPLATLIALEQQFMLVVYREAGLAHPNEDIVKRRVAIEVERTAACLRDGPWHSTFWLLVDRFYYEFYQPWRSSRLSYMEGLAQPAALVLGGMEVSDTKKRTPADTNDLQMPLGMQRYQTSFPSGVLYYNQLPPALEWLPQQNPLRSSTAIADRIQKGKTLVYFWVEPFELFDTSFVEPGIFGVSFAAPGVIYENFLQFVESLSSRAQAFADPTRLIIMRMMRHFSLDNTTMSNYMGVSRPTVSEHARILREAGFIQTYQEGRQARHEVQPEAVAQFLRDLIEYLDLDIEL